MASTAPLLLIVAIALGCKPPPPPVVEHDADPAALATSATLRGTLDAGLAKDVDVVIQANLEERQRVLARARPDATGAFEIPIDTPRLAYLRLEGTSPTAGTRIWLDDHGADVRVVKHGDEVAFEFPPGSASEALQAAFVGIDALEASVNEAAGGLLDRATAAAAAEQTRAVMQRYAAAARRPAVASVRHIMGLRYLFIHTNVRRLVALDDADAEAIATMLLGELPLDSPLWALTMDLPARVRACRPDARDGDPFDVAMANHPLVDVAARYTASMGIVALRRGDEAAFERRVGKLDEVRLREDPARTELEQQRNAPLLPGRRLPDFEITTVDGAKTGTQARLGRQWLIVFWAEWCGPCVAEMDRLHQLAKREPDLDIVTVMVDATPADLATFRRNRWPLPWVNASIEGAAQGRAVRDTLGFDSLPTSVLVANDGTIEAIDLDNVERRLAD